jgi:hypothetical protein
MEGYEVVTSDDCNLGRVVALEGDYLIIEHGTLRKAKHAVPKTFAHSDEGEQIVRLSVSKDIIESSPKLENGALDQRAIAEHYGLAGGFEAPETAGYGDVLPDDPGLSAEQEAIRAGITPAPEERVRVREEMEHPEKELGSSPGMLGDRIRER